MMLSEYKYKVAISSAKKVHIARIDSSFSTGVYVALCGYIDSFRRYSSTAEVTCKKCLAGIERIKEFQQRHPDIKD
mgnify:CR=1 FL=1